MRLLRNLSCAFTSGIIGAMVLVGAQVLIQGVPSDMTTFKHNLYRLMIWGGVWALLLIIPFCGKRWFIRGSIIGLAVILVNFLVLMPLSGKGYFAVDAGWVVFFSNIGCNYLWGIVAALWYKTVQS